MSPALRDIEASIADSLEAHRQRRPLPFRGFVVESSEDASAPTPAPRKRRRRGDTRRERGAANPGTRAGDAREQRSPQAATPSATARAPQWVAGLRASRRGGVPRGLRLATAPPAGTLRGRHPRAGRQPRGGLHHLAIREPDARGGRHARGDADRGGCRLGGGDRDGRANARADAYARRRRGAPYVQRAAGDGDRSGQPLRGAHSHGTRRHPGGAAAAGGSGLRQQLRLPGPQQLLRRAHLPPRAPRLRRPGRRPHGRRRRRARLRPRGGDERPAVRCRRALDGEVQQGERLAVLHHAGPHPASWSRTSPSSAA